MLLEHTGTEYKEKQYKCGPAPDFDKSCWFEIKETLGFDFPNLPYMIDGIYYSLISIESKKWYAYLIKKKKKSLRSIFVHEFFKCC